MSTTITVNDWVPETKSLLQTLQKHRLTILSVDNGENQVNFIDVTLNEFINETMACDEAWLKVEAPDGKKKTLYLVYGNSPGELVCDYTVCPEIDAATDEHYEAWEGRKQPTKTEERGW